MDATNRTQTARQPGRKWISLGLLVAVILVYVLLVTGRSREPLGTVGPAIGNRLTHLELVSLTGDVGKAVSLKDLGGKVVLVNYWGTWCPPCVRELPQIEAIGERFAGREDFRLLAVSCGQGADEDFQTLREETEHFLDARVDAGDVCRSRSKQPAGDERCAGGADRLSDDGAPGSRGKNSRFMAGVRSAHGGGDGSGN